MDKERVNLGLGGKSTPEQVTLAGSTPYCASVGDCLADGRTIWRYKAPSHMRLMKATLTTTSNAPNVMVEVYYNGKYVLEIPLLEAGTTLSVPVELNWQDLVELKLATRGEAPAQVNDVWILFCANTIS
ncbi:MAG: hypothetical protein KAH38_05835 [Candidatus Hydrogenedentes bacterium]|nr:hypothetical protein [Candidatus Hydrogenedentota bacterium]